MTSQDETNKLLQSIEDWYDQNGSSAAIPDIDHNDPEVKAAFNETFNSQSTHKFSYGGGELDDVSGNVLPLLVGMKLGFSQSVLRDIVSHHDISIYDISNIDYSDDRVAILRCRNGDLLQKNEFISTVFQVMNTITIQQILMINAGDALSDIHLGCMHTDNEQSWPASRIKNRANIAQIANPLKSSITLSNHDFGFIISRLTDLSSLPNSSPMDFLNRIGMLLPETSKRITAHYAMWEEMADESLKGHASATRILEFCANHKNPEIQARVKQAILSLGGWEFTENPGEMFNHLKNIFDNDIYRETFANVIPRINLVPFEENDFLAYFPEDPNYCDFLNQKSTLLSTVAKEILSQPIEDIGYSQMIVFSKLKHLDLPAQIVEGFSPEELINHVLDGVNNYTAKATLEVCHKSIMDLDVKRGLTDLVTLIQFNYKIDYEVFQARTSSEKALLVECGFPIKEMKGLTYQDKGHIFTRDLGM